MYEDILPSNSRGTVPSTHVPFILLSNLSNNTCNGVRYLLKKMVLQVLACTHPEVKSYNTKHTKRRRGALKYFISLYRRLNYIDISKLVFLLYHTI